MSTIGYLTTTNSMSVPSRACHMSWRRSELVDRCLSRTPAYKLPALRPGAAHLYSMTVSVFNGTPSNPTEEAVREGVAT